MAQSLAAVLRDVVSGADAIYTLWTDRIRGIYLDPPITVVSANRISRRRVSANLAARDRAAIIRPEARAELERLEEHIALALALDVPAPTTYTDLESRLSDVLARGEDLVEHLAEDGKHVSLFREARDRIELMAVSLAITDEGGEDDDGSGDIIDETGPQGPGSLIPASRDLRKGNERERELACDSTR
jgi:hypothetical protein